MVASRPESEGCEFDPRGGLVLDLFRFLSHLLQIYIAPIFLKERRATQAHLELATGEYPRDWITVQLTTVI